MDAFLSMDTVAFNINIVHIVVTATLIVLTVLLFLLVRNRRQDSAYKISKILSPITRSRVDNIIIPDGIGGLLEIEQLRLLEQGILIVETYQISGHLFGAEEIDQWTQLIKGRSYKFANPLRHIRTSRQAIMSLAPDTPIFYCVIFSGEASFPKGKPEGVSIVDSLTDDLKAITFQAKQTQATQLAWDKLLRIARQNGQAAKLGEEI
jgi:hypothetical protein